MSKKNLIYILLAANLAIIFWFWQKTSGADTLGGGGLALIAIGRLFGLLAAFGIITQFLLMSRAPWLEKIFGLDKLARVHHLAGFAWPILLLAHPIAIVAGYNSFTNSNWFRQSYSIITGHYTLTLAFVALIIFLVIVFLSINTARKFYKYETWYYVHLGAYLALVFSFFHQISAGTTLLSSPYFRAYWISLFALTIINHLAFRLVRPLWLFYRHNFTVREIKQEISNVFSVIISGRQMEKFAIKPGQFMFLRFLDKNRRWQAHPFSLSRPLIGDNLRVTIKNSGDFTSEIDGLKPGTRVIVDGPYGVFVDKNENKKALLVAGGIGITPLRSLFEDMLNKGKDTILLYANRTKNDIVFADELSAIDPTGRKFIHILSEEKTEKYENGRLDIDKIKRLAPDFTDRHIYLCGPPPMIHSLLNELKIAGVPAHRIKHELFSL